jgi:DNA-binding NtrC family response regulator
MPEMSGWDVAEKINAQRPGLTVALVTGWGTSLDEADAAKRGVSAVVHKPFEIDELLAVAQRLLSKSIAVAKN